MTRFLFFVIFFLLNFGHVSGQNFSFINYTQRNGLPSSNTYNLLQDKDGYLWICTENGLSRFDGSQFKNFSDKDGLPENETFLAYQDSKSRIWLYNYSNDIVYVSENKIYTSQNDTILKHDFKFFNIKSIFEDKEQNIWFAGYNLCRFTPNRGWQKFPLKPHEVITELFYNDNNELCLLGNNGIYKVVNDSLVKTNYYSFNKYFTYQTHYKNNVIAFNGKNEYKFEISADSLHLKVINNYPFVITKIKFDEWGNEWICTAGSGAFKVNPYSHDTINYLPGKTITDVLIDKENNLWFSTFGSGIYLLSTPNVTIMQPEDGLHSSIVYAVYGDKDENIWVGFESGCLNRINNTGTSKICLNTIDGYNRSLHFMDGDNDSIYVTGDQGVYAINKKKLKYTFHGISTVSGKGLYISKDKIYYAGSRWAIIKSRNTATKDIIIPNRFICVAEAGNGQSYWGLIDGLFMLKDSVMLKVDSSFAPFNSRIIYLAPSGTSGLWVATAGKGIIYYDLQSKRKHVFNMSNGLLSNNCKHIFIDQFNSAWVSTYSGLSRIIFNPHTSMFSISNYTTSDGLPIDEINQAFVRRDTLWMATFKGLACIAISQHKNYILPNVLIASCQTSVQNIYKPESINLKHWENRISILVNGISFSAGGHLRYKYKLYGLDNDWCYTFNNEISYASLQPGNYTLIVYAIHPKGMASLKPAVLKICVAPPFWKQVWFLCLVVLVFLLLLYSIYKFRWNFIHKKTIIKNQLLTSEIRALRAQMNPHFIFNALNSIQDFIFSSKQEDANYFLSEFAKLIRMIFDNAQQNIISLADETDFLSIYLKLEKLRLGDKLSYTITIGEIKNTDNIAVPNMIIQPFIENAIIHGISPLRNNGKLLVEFFEKENSLYCKITDTGIGYDNSIIQKAANKNKFKERKSSGIKNVHERINALNEIFSFKINFKITTIAVSEKELGGTEVLISFPMKNIF